MIVLVSGATKTFRRFNGHPNFGHLKTPRNGNCVASILASGCAWAADNDAFVRFDERMVGQIAGQPRLLWVTAPDVVGNAPETLRLFDVWRNELACVPIALVGQDGAENLLLPWGDFACLFIGGSTVWKLSEAAESLAKEAKARGKWVHMGRVNSRKRIQHAWEIGCDSVDGTAFSKWPDKYFPNALRWLNRIEKQPTLAGI